ncbi:MAG TPA: ornithine carbamoyltransferase [Armatimonadetes bacterium]|nr:ornithine carbamoyltransferase [Armatimonadota bacterium]
MNTRHLVSIADLSRAEVEALLARARNLKAEGKSGRMNAPLRGQTLALIFEKPSLRTRVTFEAGMTQLGGHAVYLAPADIQLGVRETVADVARNLSRWVQGIAARTYAHRAVEELAAHATVPVINALTEREHPCQALADFLTILEHKGTLAGLKLAFVGDGNNVCHSLLLLAGTLGVNMSVGHPRGYAPAEDIVAQARQLATAAGSTIELTNDPQAAVAEADAVYTDVWASMGQEDTLEERRRVFQPYQLNAQLLRQAKPEAIVLHCLPAHRGEEITDEVIDGPQSVVLDEAENRLHIQKALLLWLLGA